MNKNKVNEEDLSWLSDAVKGKKEAQSTLKPPVIPQSRERGDKDAKKALQKRLNEETTQEDREIAGVEVADAGFEVTKGKQSAGISDAWEDSQHTSDAIEAMIRFLNSPLIVDKFTIHANRNTKKLLEELASGKITPQAIKVGKETPRRNWELKQSAEIQQLLKKNRISINLLQNVVASLYVNNLEDWEDLAIEYPSLKEKADNLKAMFRIMKDEKVEFDDLPKEVKLRTAKLATDVVQELLQIFGYQSAPR